MQVSFEAALFYLAFFDAIFAVFIAWSGRGESFNARYAFFARYLPVTRGWTLYYLVLVLWVGYALTRLDVI
jgi:hypothetical protein